MSKRPMETPRQELFKMISGYKTTQALYVAAKLSIADHLIHGPKTADELAKEIGTNPKTLLRLMRHLASLGIFTQDESKKFGLTPLGKLLRDDNHESMRYNAIFAGEENYKAFGDLLHTVRTGETGFNHLYGKGHFDWLAEHPEESSTFNKAMAQSLRRLGNPLESYDYSGKHLIVDVGGGRGDLISSIMRVNPSLKGILFDLPQGIGEAQSHLRTKGVADRCQIIPGSFFNSVPEGGDVYVLSRILHDWPDDKAAAILANCRKAIKEDGILLIRDSVLSDRDELGSMQDVTMMIMTGGEERTESDWKNLLHSTGFLLAKVHKKEGQLDFIEAKPDKQF
jgi:DNA-binding HxlR family transcriptional regulator/2-polyprenyl-3-methyl-5-hydroxy-6-metoxy-1,4-benzoquinol methylase